MLGKKIRRSMQGAGSYFAAPGVASGLGEGSERDPQRPGGYYRAPEDGDFLYDDVDEGELDRMLASLDQEVGSLDPSDDEGRELYQRQRQRLLAAKQRRSGRRQSNRPRVSSVLTTSQELPASGQP